MQKYNFMNKLGRVIQVGDGIAVCDGLESVMQGELVELPNNVFGNVLNLENNKTGIILFGDYTKIKEGDIVKPTGKVFEVPVGRQFIGRVIDPLGNALDSKGVIKKERYRRIESEAPGIMDRTAINESLQTGIKVVDALIPIGKGQRQLIIGDRQTGKTTIAIDTILNQKGKNVFCIYVAIGQKQSSILSIYKTLRVNGAMKYTTIVSASASMPSSLLYIAPYAGVSLAEELMYEGRDVLIIYDDLTKHANAYRELSLLLKRPPGREAFPGDVFYLHSRLLERACKLNDELKGGSITALPIVETQSGDISAYIPTNIISITDGQIFLQSSLFYQGVRPAVNPGLSVSRVGGAAQTKAIKKVASNLRLDLSTFRELESFTQFGSDIDAATARKLERGRRTVEVLKQEENKTLDLSEEVILLYALTRGYLDDIEISELKQFEVELFWNLKVSPLGRKIKSFIEENKDIPDENLLKEYIKEVKIGY